jgi:hypothetical protein
VAEELVSLDQLKAHLRVSASVTAEDDDLQMKLDQAHEAVLDFVKQRISDAVTWEAEVDAWTDETVPKRVVAAILRMAGYLYQDRGDMAPQDWPKLELGELPRDVVMLLYRQLDPALS